MYRRNFTYLKVKYLCYLLPLLFAAVGIKAQTAVSVSGVVTDVKGLPLPGVSVTLKGTANGVTTSNDGKYVLNVPDAQGVLVFSFVGYQKQELNISGRKTVDVSLNEEDNLLDDVVVVAYGQQKKESMVSSITTINPKELKGPTSNLTTMLAGRLSGVVAYQRSGEPGADNAQFFIRGITSFGSGKVDPLILIDGMESTSNALARLQPDDISGFSVLKDAAASSLYGARGANGVVLVTTKSGVSGKTKFNVRFENSVSSNTQNFQLADNITYMKLANEAVLTRNPLGLLPYSQTKIDRTAAGANPMLYPSNNWIDMLIKDYTMNQRFNMNMTGGGNVAQYYIAGTFNQDNGVLKSEAGNNFDNNVNLKSYEIRSNVNVKLTPTTEGIVRTSGSFDDYNGPVGGYDGNGNRINGGALVFASALSSNPVNFPATYPASALSKVTHPLFGNATLAGDGPGYTNPYARMVSGFQQYNTSTLNVQLEVKQDFKFITEGLNARVMAYTQRYSYFDLSRAYTPYYYSATPTSADGKNYSLNLLNELNATEYLNYTQGAKVQNTTTYMEAAVNYNRTFGEKHSFSGLLVTLLRNYLNANAGTLQLSLPFRNQGLSGRFTYGYDNRYLLEANFGYNGSERFAENHRYGFFPSVGVAWNVSNEKFMQPLAGVVSKLKFRATYGLVGNDQIGNSNDRFFYLSNVNLSDANRAARFGTDYSFVRNGVSISRYSNEDITWEKAQTTNIGMDLSLFGSMNLIVDVYRQHRRNILMNRAYIPNTMGLAAGIQANVGEAEGKGIDLSLDYNKSFGDMWIQGRSTFTYATNKFLVNEEPEYASSLYYLSRVGNPLQQTYGLIAERLFVDDEEVRNSPYQNFGEVRGGDIKYRDVNGDGQITSLDVVPLGLPTTPEIVYGFGLSMGYKNFDVSGFFQGSGRSSFWISPGAITPFAFSGGSQNGLLEVIANDHWSEDNRNVTAFWPRLDQNVSSNNTQTSNWWMRNGSFLRLKNVELGYNISEKALRRLHIGSIRLYANGTNLFVKSSFKLWDPEQGSNGLGYPVQKVFNFGMNVQF
ncbi:SusC/RagA family TonB-linked outer membrane protein [Pedobacter psychroterrae]|uniref:TonB-dependent receptor n=1 Tax=Pedobacter psychroterrae TaxID=2530453 RepID=A0A4R0ND55_9SPHI|nr:TonB-dependent receptor [Pedobacter psychroterrae]TCC98290.1 TonB-dependent receptor [Pedobacter psychroterrae]